MVVIAIIAILAAILFPVFARARENARRASCQSNEKNIALGFKQYIQDNGEKYPPAMANAAVLRDHPGIQEYIKSTAIFFCPSDSNKTGVSYGYKLTGENESAIQDTATTILLNESGPRHFAGMNIAYVDGHVKWTKDSLGFGSATGDGVWPSLLYVDVWKENDGGTGSEKYINVKVYNTTSVDRTITSSFTLGDGGNQANFPLTATAGNVRGGVKKVTSATGQAYTIVMTETATGASRTYVCSANGYPADGVPGTQTNGGVDCPLQ